MSRMSKCYRNKLSMVIPFLCLTLVWLVTWKGQAFAATAQCASYEGANGGRQNYSRYASPVNSYLIETENGQLMRLQGDALNKKYLVEYYDKSYNIQEVKKIDKELSLFGAFYDDGSYYYVLSGQTNYEEEDSKEVYRITKYDHKWNRLGAASLKGANTYSPFDAGSARVVHEGKNLFIRTCHEMYQSSDGYHHQANVTIQVDTEAMKVVDSFYDVMNSSYGYVSHSFNQFILLDQGHIVGLDHGDAYPRAIALLKYIEPYSSSGFVKDCNGVSMLSIDGQTGDNDTGVSIGGFQMSDTSYLVAGNSVAMGSNYDPYGVRNIFVSSVDRNLSTNPKVTWVTSYTGKSASTPQFVKLNQGAYLLMWTQNDKLNYCTIDGKGQVSSQIYKMEGALSDCVPLISGNQAIWYVWENETVSFYSINLTDLSDTKTVKIKNGHDYKTTYPKSGKNVVKQVCQRKDCGHKKEFTTITSFSAYWRYSEDDDGYYWSNYQNEVKKGSWYDLLYTNLYPENVDDSTIVMTSSDKSVATIKDDRIRFIGKGAVTITLKALYNPNCKQKVTFYSGVKGIGFCNIQLKYYETTYTGSAKKPKVTVERNGKTLTKGTDYKVTYSNNVDAGKAKVKITGMGKYAGTDTVSFTIKKASNQITASNVTKTKKNKKQTFNLKASALEDAKLTYTSNNSKITVSESGKVSIPSGYSGTATITIKAAATKNYKKTSKKVTVTVK